MWSTAPKPLANLATGGRSASAPVSRQPFRSSAAAGAGLVGRGGFAGEHRAGDPGRSAGTVTSRPSAAAWFVRVTSSHEQEGSVMRRATVVLLLMLTSVSVVRAEPVTLTVSGVIESAVSANAETHLGFPVFPVVPFVFSANLQPASPDLVPNPDVGL
jgi:hypothetical protein